MFLCSSVPSPASCCHRLALEAGRDTSALCGSQEVQSFSETRPHSPHPAWATRSIPGEAETTDGEVQEVHAAEVRQTLYLH